MDLHAIPFISKKYEKKHIVVPILPRMCHGQKHGAYIYTYGCGHLTIIGNLVYG